MLCTAALTLILLTWIIWWASNNANRWQMGFNSAFKVLSSTAALSTIKKKLPRKFLNICKKKLSELWRFKEQPYLSCVVCFKIYSASTNRSTVNYWLDNSRWRTYWCRQQFISYPHLSICETADWYDLRLAYDRWCSKSFDATVSTTEINRVSITGMINGRGKGDREGG